jgi:hypothetical protein
LKNGVAEGGASDSHDTSQELLQCAIKKISKLEIDGIIMGIQNYD